MTSVFTFIKTLKWCTELPTKDFPRISPDFLINGNKWFFRLVLERGNYGWYFLLTLDLKSVNTEFKPLSGKVQVGFENLEDFRLGTEKFKSSESGKAHVWNKTVDEFRRERPSDYVQGSMIHFLFSFNVDEPPLKMKKVVVDRSIQTAAYLNAVVLKEGLSKDLSELLDTGRNHDIEIKCGEHTIMAHKIVLSARSDVFKAMLESGMRESQTGVVEIQDMDVSYFEDFVRYLYTDTISELTFDRAKALYEAGDKYNVRSLMLRCSEYFQDNITIENIFQCCTLADAHSDLKLKDKVISRICLKKA